MTQHDQSLVLLLPVLSTCEHPLPSKFKFSCPCAFLLCGIALVQLTGQNFGANCEAWGKWWNESGGDPAYRGDIIRWWNGEANTIEGLKESLAENDRKFLQGLK